MQKQNYRQYIDQHLKDNGLSIRSFHKKHKEILSLDSLKKVLSKNRHTKTFTAKQTLSNEKLVDLLISMHASKEKIRELLVEKLKSESPKLKNNKLSNLALAFTEIEYFLSVGVNGPMQQKNESTSKYSCIITALQHLPPQASIKISKEISTILVQSLEKRKSAIGTKKIIDELKKLKEI